MNRILSLYIVTFISFLFYLLVVIFYWGWNQGGELIPLLACISHVFMLHVLGLNFVKSIYADRRRIFSPLSIFFVIHFFYFSITFLKYFREPHYSEFTSDVFRRLFGTFLVFSSMLILLRWRSWWSSRHPDKTIPILQKLGESYGFQFIVFIGCVITVIGLYFANINSASSTKMPLLERNTGIVVKIASSFFFPMLIAVLFMKKGIIKRMFLSILVVTVFAIIVFTGERTALMVTILLLFLYNLYGMKSNSNMLIRAAVFLFAAPIIIIAISVPLTDYVKKGINNKDPIQVVERGELSDYAISIASLDHRPSLFAFLNIGSSKKSF